MKKIGILLLIGIILATAVYAQDFSALLIPQTDSIRQNETAIYKLAITHPFGAPQTFEVYSTDILWDVRTEDSLIIDTGENFETQLYLRPLNLNPGVYSIPLSIKLTGTDQIITENLNLEVKSQYPPSANYLPAIRGTVTMSRKADPKDPIMIYVKLENQNKKLLKNIRIKLRSNVINKDYDAELKPQETKKFTFKAEVDPYTSPQTDLMKVTAVVIEDEEVYQFDLTPVEYTVVHYSNLEEEIIKTKETFKTIQEIILKNNGNIQVQEKYYLPTNLLESLFTTTQPESYCLGDSRIWEINIEPGETIKLQMTVNYRPLAFLISALIILIIAYIIFRSPLIMRKQAIVIGTREGGISELKVLLTLKNRTNKKISNLRIIDLVPRLAVLKQDSEMGTVNPDKVMHNERQGTLLRWHIDQIDGGEERIISYKISSKLSILGGVTLPVAVAKFLTPRGRTRHSNSNKARIGFLG